MHPATSKEGPRYFMRDEKSSARLRKILLSIDGYHRPPCRRTTYVKDTMNEKSAPAPNPAKMDNRIKKVAFIQSSISTRRSAGGLLVRNLQSPGPVLVIHAIPVERLCPVTI